MSELKTTEDGDDRQSEFASVEERDRYVIRLRYRLKFTERAIAQALNLSLGMVHRIIEKHEKNKETVQ